MASLEIFMAITLFLTLSPTFSHQRTPHHGIIQTECHNSETPAVCMECLKSDPHAAKASRVGIATIIVHCLTNHSNTLLKNMSKLASKTHVNASKRIFEDCKKSFVSSRKELDGARSALKKRDFDGVVKSVDTALEYELTCSYEITGAKLDSHVPIDVIYTMRIFQELSEAALRIIERL